MVKIIKLVDNQRGGGMARLMAALEADAELLYEAGPRCSFSEQRPPPLRAGTRYRARKTRRQNQLIHRRFG